MTWNWKIAVESIRPLKGKILIRPMGDPEMASEHIIMPDTVKERPQKAEILALGAGIREDVQVGDFILMNPWSDSDRISLEPHGEELAVVDEKLVICVLLAD